MKSLLHLLEILVCRLLEFLDTVAYFRELLLLALPDCSTPGCLFLLEGRSLGLILLNHSLISLISLFLSAFELGAYCVHSRKKLDELGGVHITIFRLGKSRRRNKKSGTNR